ncbi:hypothetical protein JCM21531_3338 [Acetivibrio straminisolvens JCM 21531]|uniref:Uncharacterized protein n=1 Tax=Acetivibrio straminisolvens JCM 21531 TaxID=1294263 RepID=W4VAE4_9FIRM|nr:hypothetical protein JCM21531_3338 [Acetivibrio straminisolvens JCM 21531]
MLIAIKNGAKEKNQETIGRLSVFLLFLVNLPAIILKVFAFSHIMEIEKIFIFPRKSGKDENEPFAGKRRVCLRKRFLQAKWINIFNTWNGGMI